MQAPKKTHWAALRVVRYLKGSPDQGIFLTSDKDLILTIYCYSDWASCPLTRRSLSAFVVVLGGSSISWKTKKQQTVSHSSAEAEYRSMAASLREVKLTFTLLSIQSSMNAQSILNPIVTQFVMQFMKISLLLIISARMTNSQIF